MKLEQLIEKLGLPENPRKGQHAYAEYWKFNDGSVVVGKDELEQMLCYQEQEWFWEEANNDSLEPHILAELDEGSTFKDEEYWVSELLEDYQNPEPLAGEYASVFDAIANGVYWDAFVEISSEIDGLDDIVVDLEPYFEEYYSKTTDLFCWGYASVENGLLAYFDSDSATYELWEDLKEALQKNFPQYAKKLITLITSGEAGARQAFELIESIDTDLALEDYYDVFSDEEFINAPFDGLEKIAIALTEIEESPSDPFSDLFDWIVAEVSSQMDWDKPYSIYQAYTYSARRYGEGTLYINEDRINWNICMGIEADLDAFENLYWIESERWKKIFQMGDWFIALA